MKRYFRIKTSLGHQYHICKGPTPDTPAHRLAKGAVVLLLIKASKKEVCCLSLLIISPGDRVAGVFRFKGTALGLTKRIFAGALSSTWTGCNAVEYTSIPMHVHYNNKKKKIKSPFVK